MWPPFCLTTSCKRTLAFVTTFRHKSSESARRNFTMWALSCAVAQLRAHIVKLCRALLWRLMSKSCDEWKGSFARGCEAKRWSHWTCSSLGTIFQPMRINSVPDVKCFCNNKNVLRAQSVLWHFLRHPVLWGPIGKKLQTRYKYLKLLWQNTATKSASSVIGLKTNVSETRWVHIIRICVG